MKREYLTIILFPIIVAFSYTVLRFQMNTEYHGATWEQLYNLTAKLPFGHRILVPLLSRFFVELLGMKIGNAFFVFEFCFSLLTIVFIYKVFRIYLNSAISYCFSVLFVAFLTFPFLLKHVWAVYYPYDTAAVFFMVAGFYYILKEKWSCLLLVMILGAINRESIVFLVPLFVLLSLDKLKTKNHLVVLFGLAAVFFACRILISLILTENENEPLHFYIGNKLRVLNNIKWIAKKPFSNTAQFLSSIGFLPIIWMMLRKYIPQKLKRIEIWSVIFFSPLLVVGNIYEPRIFGEMIAVLYIPVMIAVYNRVKMNIVQSDFLVSENVIFEKDSESHAAISNWITLIDRYGLIVACFIAIVSIAVFVLLKT